MNDFLPNIWTGFIDSASMKIFPFNLSLTMLSLEKKYPIVGLLLAIAKIMG